MYSTTSTTATLLLATLFVSTAQAANDWSKACTSGYCEWDTGDGVKTAWSNLAVKASTSNTLADITTAAGWQILGCDAKSSGSQSIRMICTDAAKCNHLFDGDATDKVIRLPNSCGAGPFARVQKTWISEDQALPKGINAKRADGTKSRVYALMFDYKLSAIPQSKGSVAFAISSSNNKALAQKLSTKKTIAPRAHTRDFTFEKRFGFSDIGNAIKGAADKVGNGIQDAASAVKDGAQAAGNAIKGGAQAAQGAVTQTITNSKDGSSPIKFSKKGLNLITASLDCAVPGVPASGTLEFKVNADVNVDGNVKYGLVLAGTVIPPAVSDFSLFATATGAADVVFDIKAAAIGKVGTGDVPLFETGLPGLSIPGIFTVGPDFSVVANAGLTLEASVDMQVGASWDLSNVDLRFPKGDGTPSTAASKPAPLDIKLDSASVNGKGTIEAHLIPKLSFGVDVLAGFAKADIFLKTDLSGSTNLAVTLDILKAAGAASIADSVGGCVDSNLGISIKAGVEGGIPGIFTAGQAITLFQKSANVFEQCFGSSPPKVNNGVPPAAPNLSVVVPNVLVKTLSCPITISALSNLISTKISVPDSAPQA